jgi:hypothetical protein
MPVIDLVTRIHASPEICFDLARDIHNGGCPTCQGTITIDRDAVSLNLT